MLFRLFFETVILKDFYLKLKKEVMNKTAATANSLLLPQNDFESEVACQNRHLNYSKKIVFWQ